MKSHRGRPVTEEDAGLPREKGIEEEERDVDDFVIDLPNLIVAESRRKVLFYCVYT